MDANGRPTTDPVAALSGVLLPMAGHKRHGISLAMEVLSGVLSGSGVLDDVSGPYQAENRSACGHVVLALDIARFLRPGEFALRMEGWIARLEAAPLAAAATAVLYLGIPPRARRGRRLGTARRGWRGPGPRVRGLEAEAARYRVALPSG